MSKLPPIAEDAPIKHVALVSDYSLGTLGGAQTAYTEQARALAGDYHLTLVCPASRQLEELAREVGVTSVGVPIGIRVPVVELPMIRNSKSLRTLLRDAFDGVDVIHLHSEFGIGAATVQVAEELGIPVVHTIHCWLWTNYPIQYALRMACPPFHRWITGFPYPRAKLADKPGDSAMRNMTLAVAQRADRIVLPSAHTADQVRSSGLTEIDVIPNALAVAPDTAPLERVGGPLRIAWIGRCVEVKKLITFVRACAAAIDRVGAGRLEVDVVGEGESLPKARALAKGYPGIRFHGRRPHTEVAGFLERCHVSALTSVGFDNQPMSVVESVMNLRGVIYRDPELTEGLSTGAGIPAFGDETVLSDLLVDLVRDPAPVIAASKAAVEARTQFAGGTFCRQAAITYRTARRTRELSLAR